jgi:hypothetical protein
VRPLAFGTTPREESFHVVPPAVALLQGGGYAAVWTGAPAGVPYADVRMQWVRPDGSFVFPRRGLVVSSHPDPEYDPIVVADRKGGVFVAYSRHTDRQGDRIVVQRFDADGRPVWAGRGTYVSPVSLNQFQFLPALLADGRGGAFVCFSRDRQVACQRLSPDGRRLWGASGVLTGGVSGWRMAPHLLRDVQGGILVFWRNQRAATPGAAQKILMEGQRLSGKGEPLWGEQGLRLRETGLPGEGRAEIPPFDAVSDGAGGALLAFDDRLSGTGRDVVALRVGPDGRLLWGAGVAVAAGEPGQSFRALVSGPDGSVFVAVSVDGQGGRQTRLFRLDPEGRPLWDPEGVPLFAAGGGREADESPHLAYDGGVLRVVASHTPDPSQAQWTVRLALFTADGARLGDPAGFALSGAASYNPPRGFVFDPERGQGFAVWETFADPEGFDENTVGALWSEG